MTHRPARPAGRAGEPPAVDGRVRRGERSRDGIVSAMLALIGEGELRPTAQQVADRAGVGIRSVFRHFREMESLYAEMNARLEVEAAALLAGEDRPGPLAARARALVRQRARLFERIAPYKRASNAQRGRSRFLEERHRDMQRRLRADLLARLPELGDTASELVEALDLATSFEAWDRLRGDRRLGARAAAAVMERTVAALLRNRGR